MLFLFYALLVFLLIASLSSKIESLIPFPLGNEISVGFSAEELPIIKTFSLRVVNVCPEASLSTAISKDPG